MNNEIIDLINKRLSPEYEAQLIHEDLYDIDIVEIIEVESSDILDTFILDYIIKGIRSYDSELIAKIIENSFAYKLLSD